MLRKLLTTLPEVTIMEKKTPSTPQNNGAKKPSAPPVKAPSAPPVKAPAAKAPASTAKSNKKLPIIIIAVIAATSTLRIPDKFVFIY